MRRMFIISGCNGSGKTTASYSLLPEMLDCREFVNSDEFAKSLSPFNPGAASVLASRYMLRKIKYMIERDLDFCVETTLATRYLLGIIREAKERGYVVTLIYFWLNSPELAVQRVSDRVAAGGHSIPEEVIRRRYYMGLRYFFETYSKNVDRWVLADNSKSPFTVVAEYNAKITNIKDNEKYQTILSMVQTKKPE